MTQELDLSRSRLTTPRAASIAGILFSLLYMAVIILIRSAVPEKPEELGDWLSTGWKTVTLALNLLPFAGIAFLWFIGVVRDRWESMRTASLPPFFWAADCCSWPCSLPLPPWQAAS